MTVRRTWMVHVHLAAAIIVAGCHQSPPLAGAQSAIVPDAHAAALAKRLAGCYRLDDGPWHADSVHAGSVSMKYASLWFELTETASPRWRELQSSDRPLFIARDSSGRSAGFDFEEWQPISSSSDSIRVAHPLAFAGFVMFLAPDATDLVGSLTAFTDAVREGEPSEVSRPVRARRVSCP